MRQLAIFSAFLLLSAAAGYAQAPTFLFESFESSWSGGAPAGWTKTNVIGSADWAQQVVPFSGQQPPRVGGAAGARHGIAAAWFATSAVPGSTTRLESPSVDLSVATTARLRFFHFNQNGVDSLRVLASTNGGTTWDTLARYGNTGTATTWVQRWISLAPYVSSPNVKIALEAVADSGTSDIWIDKVMLQYPEITVRQVQERPLDSLLVADTLQNSIPTRWTLQVTPFNGDTVTVTALCVVPAKVFGFTAAGWNMLLYDTADIGEWRGLFVRVNAPADTAAAEADNFLQVQIGRVVRMTGLVSEFPAIAMNSLTQIQPIPGIQIELLGFQAVPPPPLLSASTFYSGLFPGTVRFSSGEPYESMVVQLNGLTVTSYLNQTNGTFTMVQGANNISDYDASDYYTLRRPNPPGWTYVLPPLNSTIDSIRGGIWVVSGGENPRGYRIAPVFPGDLNVGVSLPIVTSQRRYPIVVPSDSSARINVRAFKQDAGYDIGSVKMYYSLNGGAFNEVTMSLVNPVDSTYEAVISNQPESTFVRYFFKAFDIVNNATTLASFASSGGNDTSRGFFFYSVTSRPITIRDVQYTPFANGYSPYAENYPFGAVVSVSGMVTADTSNMLIFPRSIVGGTNAWYIQSGSEPWNGIWVVGAESTMAVVDIGDSVTVTGIVQEWPSFSQNVTTRIADVQYPVSVHSQGNPLPAPVVKPTRDFGPAIFNGDTAAEPYEGMLVKFNNVTVTDIYPYFSDPTQYEISDGSGGVWVHRDGNNTYTNVPADSIDATWHVLRVGDVLTSVTGIIHFSVNRYKFVPRSNADFELPVGVITRGNMLPTRFDLMQNFPNPFNPVTTIQYDIPSASFVILKIYNVLGQEVTTLVNQEQIAGRYTARFDASFLASGVYFYRLNAGNFVDTKKMMFLK